MSDQFNVTAAWNRTPPNYVPGETIIGTITGTNTHTTDPTTTTETWGPFDVPVRADGGAASTASFPAVQVTRTTPGTTTQEAVLIDAAAFAVLTLGGKQWTVSADRRSISAVA